MFVKEPPDIHEALVSDLSTSIVPTAIMGVTLVVVGSLASTRIDAATFIPVTAVAGLASIAKASFIAYHRRRLRIARSSTVPTSGIETIHMWLTVAMAASVGWLGAYLFLAPDVNAHLVATALLFAYCSGIVSRLSIRPRIAIAAIMVSALPCVMAAWLVGDMAHYVVSLIFLVFLFGSLETVAHSYRNAVRHISTSVQMAAIARRDPLTGLLNRFGLREAFSMLPRSAEITLHAFDLDGFKAVNDRLGHEGGDTVLREIASRLGGIAGDRDIAARVGGDEFVVVQPGLVGDGSAEVAAEKIHDALVRPYDVAGAVIRIGVSIGFTRTSSSTVTLETLLRDADRASYVAKRDGGGYRPHRP